MRRYIITLDVSDHHANIVNFESADALKTSSSISSGALADHSSLSEISDNCCLPQKSSGTFLRASHSEEPSSTSSSSSGLTVNQTTSAPIFIRPPDHCLCCSVLQSLKIECSCGKRNIFYVRDGPAQKEARETKASDDMDLTDPVLDRLQPEQPERVEKEGENPEADVPPVAQLSASKLDGSQPDKWSLPAREHLFCIPEKLGPKERPPEVPPNYEEDSDSIFFHLVWTMKALEALQDSRSPPEGVVRVFYDQTLGVPEWPPCVLDFTKNYCDNELRLMRSEFMRWRQEVMREFENTRENRDVIVVSDDDTSEVEDTRPESPRQDVDVQQEEPTTSKLPRTDFCERLVYAKIDQWYHPGVVHCSIEQWDAMKESLKVKFYDGDVHMMSPDKVFLFERLPSGVNIQLQTALDEYEDVVYMSHAASKHSSRLPSAILTIDDERSRIPFDKTAISPKDATHIRSILKHEFWPSKAQENSTKITADAILETKRMRKQGAIDIPLTNHVKPSVSSHKLPRKKRKVAVREEISIEVTQEKRFLCCIKNCKKTFSRFHDAKRHVRNIHGKKFLNVSMKKQPSKERTRLPSSDDQLPRKKRKVAVREEISTEVTQEKVPPPKKKKVAVSEETTDDTTDVAKEKQENTKFSCYVAGCHSCYTYEYDVRRHVKKCHGDKFLRKSARDMMKASKKACVAPNPQVLQEKSKTVPASSSTVTFANPSTSGLRLPTSGSDTDFAFSPVRSWNQFVDGHGLSRERLKFDTDVKSYVGIKGRKKIDMNTKNEVFKGHWIVFTSSSIDKKPAVRKRTNLDSESDSTDVENYYATPVKFDLAALRRAVECGGGKAACNIMDVPKDARESKESYRVILVSDHPCRTPNYLYGVASGFTIVRHDTILECFSKGITLRSALNSGSAILLPPGWDDIRMTWATPRTSHDWPFKRDLMYVALSCGADGNQFWSSVIRQLGGRPLDWFYPRQHLGDQVLAIIVDENLEEAKREVTRRHSIPLVTTAWLIQAIITGKMPSFDDMSYRLIF